MIYVDYFSDDKWYVNIPTRGGPVFDLKIGVNVLPSLYAFYLKSFMMQFIFP